MTDSSIRNQFPSLERKHNEQPLVYLDGPAGTQVPNAVIDAISNYYRTANANKGGYFPTARDTDTMIDGVRQKVATFLGASDKNCIAFGANMTTLNYSLSRSIGKSLQPGDEILITQFDHEANRGPWLALQEDGIIVREVRIQKDGNLDYNDLQSKLNERTRLVALGYASNIFGTVNDVKRVRKMTYEVGAWLLLDAVHYAPHLLTDVEEIGCDFLLCSAYKFYGPHIGILYAKPGILDRLQAYNLRTAPQLAPYIYETGTQNHAALAGVGASIDFMASFGAGNTFREKIKNCLSNIRNREGARIRQLYEGLSTIPQITILGPSVDVPLRAPTLSFIYEGKTASEVCQYLAENGICAWSGHFYAVRSTEVLGLQEKGGVLRMGMAVYNTEEEISRTVNVIKELRNELVRQ